MSASAGDCPGYAVPDLAEGKTRGAPPRYGPGGALVGGDENALEGPEKGSGSVEALQKLVPYGAVRDAD